MLPRNRSRRTVELAVKSLLSQRSRTRHAKTKLAHRGFRRRCKRLFRREVQHASACTPKPGLPQSNHVRHVTEGRISLCAYLPPRRHLSVCMGRRGHPYPEENWQCAFTTITAPPKT